MRKFEWIEILNEEISWIEYSSSSRLCVELFQHSTLTTQFWWNFSAIAMSRSGSSHHLDFSRREIRLKMNNSNNKRSPEICDRKLLELISHFENLNFKPEELKMKLCVEWSATLTQSIRPSAIIHNCSAFHMHAVASFSLNMFSHQKSSTLLKLIWNMWKYEKPQTVDCSDSKCLCWVIFQLTNRWVLD